VEPSTPGVRQKLLNPAPCRIRSYLGEGLRIRDNIASDALDGII
jgi:hypothetical protein